MTGPPPEAEVISAEHASRAAAALAVLPDGAFIAAAHGQRWRVVKTLFSGGRSAKLQAWALNGEGYVSLNLYALESGPLLRPCEMPADVALDFLLSARPEPEVSQQQESAPEPGA